MRAEPPADLIARPDNMGLREGAGRFEIGNFNIPDIHALAASLDLIERIGVNNISEHLLDLGEHLILRLDELGVRLVGPRDRPKRAHIYVLDLPGAGWPEYFASENVRISPERDGIRISFGFFKNLRDSVEQVLLFIGSERSSLPSRITFTICLPIVDSSAPWYR